MGKKARVKTEKDELDYGKIAKFLKDSAGVNLSESEIKQLFDKASSLMTDSKAGRVKLFDNLTEIYVDVQKLSFGSDINYDITVKHNFRNAM